MVFNSFATTNVQQLFEKLLFLPDYLGVGNFSNIDAILKALGDYYKKGEISGKPYGTFAGKELQVNS